MINDLILRVWDKKARKMREVDSIAFHNSKSVCDYDSSRLPKVVNVWGFNIITQQDIVLHREIEDVELMQYSGYNDINGIRIFDGDIVKTNYGDVGVVTYIKHFAQWRIRFYKGREHLTSDYKYGAELFFFIYPEIFLEVIGNKYENGEEIPA